MRRITAVAALGAAFFAVSACADVPQPEPGTSPGQTTSTGQATDLADKQTTCDDYLKVSAEVEAKATSIFASMQGAQDDPLKAASAYAELTSLLADYETRTAAIEVKAGDSELKAALKAEVDRTKAFQADLAAAGTDPVKIQAVVEGQDKELGKEIKALCA